MLILFEIFIYLFTTVNLHLCYTTFAYQMETQTSETQNRFTSWLLHGHSRAFPFQKIWRKKKVHKQLCLYFLSFYWCVETSLVQSELFPLVSWQHEKKTLYLPHPPWGGKGGHRICWMQKCFYYNILGTPQMLLPSLQTFFLFSPGSSLEFHSWSVSFGD